MRVLRLSFSGMTLEKKADAGPTEHLPQCEFLTKGQEQSVLVPM